ncbi:MAG: tRNA pseudouridine(55) synthase TruB [Brevinematales bacterium]|nr:tRNA pseudouridine(55) synthase TruB [Brevinematales bacterium]
MVSEGVLPVDKPSGILSSDVVNKIKKVLKKSGIRAKVGHGGTLDKFASGLLLVLLGKGTKLFEYIRTLQKTYFAVVKFGEFRSTDDIYGETIEELPTSHLTYSLVEETLSRFVGEIYQVPPVYSSVHIDGQRAYKMAKKDYYSTLNLLKPRKVVIYEIHLLDFDNISKEAKIFVRSSGGTYIRALARDMGKMLGTGAYLKELRRDAVGNVLLSSAVSYNTMESIQDIFRYVISVEEFVRINSV